MFKATVHAFSKLISKFKYSLIFQIGISRPSEDEVASSYAYAPDNFIGVVTTGTFSIFQSTSQQVCHYQDAICT